MLPNWRTYFFIVIGIECDSIRFATEFHNKVALSRRFYGPGVHLNEDADQTNQVCPTEWTYWTYSWLSSCGFGRRSVRCSYRSQKSQKNRSCFGPELYPVTETS